MSSEETSMYLDNCFPEGKEIGKDAGGTRRLDTEKDFIDASEFGGSEPSKEGDQGKLIDASQSGDDGKIDASQSGDAEKIDASQSGDAGKIDATQSEDAGKIDATQSGDAGKVEDSFEESKEVLPNDEELMMSNDEEFLNYYYCYDGLCYGYDQDDVNKWDVDA
jgi:hypothetical protein